MEVVKVVNGYYTMRLDKVEQSNIARLAQVWEVKDVGVFTWLIDKAIRDAILGLDKVGKRRKGGKYGD